MCEKEKKHEIPSWIADLIEGLLSTIVVVVHTLTRILCTSEAEQCTQKMRTELQIYNLI